MKKFALIVLATAMLLSVTACGNQDATNSSDAGATDAGEVRNCCKNSAVRHIAAIFFSMLCDILENGRSSDVPPRPSQCQSNDRP